MKHAISIRESALSCCLKNHVLLGYNVVTAKLYKGKYIISVKIYLRMEDRGSLVLDYNLSKKTLHAK